MNPSCLGSRGANESTSVCSGEASVRPGANGTATSRPPCLAACSTAAQPPSTIRSASETRLPPDWAALKSRWIASSLSSTVALPELASQSFCGARRIRPPLAPPRLSVPRNVEAEAHAVAMSWGTVSPEARICALSEAMSCSSISS